MMVQESVRTKPAEETLDESCVCWGAGSMYPELHFSNCVPGDTPVLPAAVLHIPLKQLHG